MSRFLKYDLYFYNHKAFLLSSPSYLVYFVLVQLNVQKHKIILAGSLKWTVIV